MNPEGTMDILLTKNEAFKAVSQGMADWDVAGRPLSQSMWYEQQAICRAQVRKVAEWIMKHNSAPIDKPHRITVGQYDAFLVRVNWQALREAAGGKG